MFTCIDASNYSSSECVFRELRHAQSLRTLILERDFTIDDGTYDDSADSCSLARGFSGLKWLDELHMLSFHTLSTGNCLLQLPRPGLLYSLELGVDVNEAGRCEALRELIPKLTGLQYISLACANDEGEVPLYLLGRFCLKLRDIELWGYDTVEDGDYEALRGVSFNKLGGIELNGSSEQLATQVRGFVEVIGSNAEVRWRQLW